MPDRFPKTTHACGVLAPRPRATRSVGVVRGDPTPPPESLSVVKAAGVLGITPQHLTMLLDRERIPYETAPDGERCVRRAELDAYACRQERAYAAMRESMLASERLADDE
jgi:hypothetical protein